MVRAWYFDIELVRVQKLELITPNISIQFKTIKIDVRSAHVSTAGSKFGTCLVTILQKHHSVPRGGGGGTSYIQMIGMIIIFFRGCNR